MYDSFDRFVDELEAGPLGNTRLWALTWTGKLLLVPTAALIAGLGYFGVTSGTALIEDSGFRVSAGVGKLFSILTMALVFCLAIGCGIGFYVLAVRLLRRCGLRAYDPHLLTVGHRDFPAAGGPVWRVCGVEVRTGCPVTRDFQAEGMEQVHCLARESGIEVKTVRKLSRGV